MPAAHRRAAIRAVALYLKENPSAPPAPVALQPRRSTPRFFSSLCVSLVLVTLFWAVQPGYEQRTFFDVFGADARRILEGELYRCLTALLFHKDAPHLVANLAGLIFFGTLVVSFCGWGIAWLLIVGAGAVGNYANAFWYQQDHISIGASTAVFAAVGINAVWSFVRRLRGSGTDRKTAWLPLAAGLALLGFTGAAANTDVLAHLFGFAAGLVVGGAFCWRLDRVPPWPFQTAAVTVLVVWVAGAWLKGLLQ